MKIMTLKINSYYTEHATAKELLASKNIDLRIINNKSPYVLANSDSPDIVVHPEASLISAGEFPEIKFCGPGCKFPNYNIVLPYGYSDYKIDEIQAGEFNDIVFLNTQNDYSFIKYLESFDKKLSIYGRQCDSLYYKGNLQNNSYSYYKNANLIAVDNEHAALKAMRSRKSHEVEVISNFDMESFDISNYQTRGDVKIFKNRTDEILAQRNWDNIFREFLNAIGETYE